MDDRRIDNRACGDFQPLRRQVLLRVEPGGGLTPVGCGPGLKYRRR